MDVFIENISSFPTAIFTTINLIIIGVWLIMALGLIDIEILDVNIDADLEISSEANNLSGLTGFLATLGLTGVPFFIVLTIIFFVSWIISYFSVKFGLFWNNYDSIRYLLGSGILIMSFLVSIPLTAQFIKPLKSLFAKLNDGSTSSKSLLGKQCKVRTSRVTLDFGEANCENEGASLILKVRADNDYELKKGDLVRIIEVDETSSFYYVIPEKEFQSNNI